MRGLVALVHGRLRGGRLRGRWRVALSMSAVLGLVSGCVHHTDVVDAEKTFGGPPLPEPLWSAAPEPAPTDEGPPATSLRPDPLPGLTVPGGADAGAVDAREVIARDPAADEDLKRAAAACAPGSGCGLRTPVLRDITRDGRRELLLFIDPDPRARPADGYVQTDPGLYAYRVDGTRVYQILGRVLAKGTQVDLQGRDLVIRATTRRSQWDGGDFVDTTRFSWNPHLRTLEQTSTVSGVAPTRTAKPPCARGAE